MKKHRHTFKIILRKDFIRKDGSCALVAQVFLNGKRKRLQLGVGVKPAEFDSKKQRVKMKDKNQEQKINAILQKAAAKANDIFVNAILEDVVLSVSRFEEMFFQMKPDFDFFGWLEAEIKKQKGVVADGTLKTYGRDFRRLKKWRSKLSFAEIDLECIKSLDRHLKRRNIGPNTVWQVHKFMKKWINVAVMNHKGLENPYKYFKFRLAKVERVFLSPGELQNLVKLYNSGVLDEILHRVLRQFLFMCFSSLRISDVRNITSENVAANYLIFRPQKTKETRMILKVPLNKIARKLIEEGDGVGERIFDMYKDNQVFNRYLKEAVYYAGITKNVTSHVGRHTYATMFLRLGGKIEVLQRLMGHSRIDTTQVYVHILAADMEEQVAYFDDIFNLEYLERHH